MDMQGVAFLGGEYVPLADAKISIMTHAFNYGTGTFEGIRGYWSAAEEQLYVFRMREHFERLHNSARILAISLPYSVDELETITLEILRRSGFRGDTYIRPIAYKSGLGIGVSMTGVSDDFMMYCQPMGNYIDIDRGIRCCLSSWRRNSDNAIPPRAKVTGAYVNAALAKHEAVVNGYDEAIMLAENGNVSEGSAENLFIIKNRTGRDGQCAGGYYARHPDRDRAHRTGCADGRAHGAAHRALHRRRGFPVRHGGAGLAGGRDRQAAHRVGRGGTADRRPATGVLRRRARRQPRLQRLATARLHPERRAHPARASRDRQCSGAVSSCQMTMAWP